MMSVYMRRRCEDKCLTAERDLAVLVFRGTRDRHDGNLDLESIVGNKYPAPIVLTAAEIVKMYQDQGCDVMVTGHSSGGYFAEITATTLGLNGAAFCAPGPGFHNGPKAGTLRGFHTINHDADSIGNHNHMDHHSKLVYVEDGGSLMLPWNAHSMAQMVTCMKRRDDWTNLNIIEKCQGE